MRKGLKKLGRQFGCFVVFAAMLALAPLGVLAGTDTPGNTATVTTAGELYDAIGKGYASIFVAEDITYDGTSIAIYTTEVVYIAAGKTLRLESGGASALIQIMPTGSLTLCGQGNLLVQPKANFGTIANYGALSFAQGLAVEIISERNVGINTYSNATIHIDTEMVIRVEDASGAGMQVISGQMEIGPSGNVQVTAKGGFDGGINVTDGGELVVRGALHIENNGNDCTGIGVYGGARLTIADGGWLYVENTNDSYGIFSLDYGNGDTAIRVESGGTAFFGMADSYGVILMGGSGKVTFEATPGSNLLFVADEANAIRLAAGGEKVIQPGANVYHAVPFVVNDAEDGQPIAGASIETAWPNNPVQYNNETLYLVQNGERVRVHSPHYHAMLHEVDFAGNLQTVLLERLDWFGPEVVSVAPQGDGLGLEGEITIAFSKEIGVAGTVALSPAGGTLGAGSLSADGITYTVPYAGLNTGTSYTVLVEGFANLDGYAMAAPYSSGPFKTFTPAGASTGGNSFSLQSGTSLTAGVPFTITATGHRQNEAPVHMGDERYIPISASANPTVAFAETEGVYTAEMTIAGEGVYLLGVTFQLQRWDGAAWQDVPGATDGQTLQITVAAAPDIKNDDQQQADAASPATGDTGGTALWLCLVLLANAGMVVAVLYKRRTRKI